MPKRKRSGEPSVQDTINKHSDDIFRALKAAKGFERQRLSKRVRDSGITPDKKERLDREIAVLKSLDLHQTAHAHLLSSLLKIKPLVESPDCPEEIRRGIAKPELSEEERVALHNVTSGLYQRAPVKQAVDRAVKSVCELLNVPVPEKGKRVRKQNQEEKQESSEELVDQEDAGETAVKDEDSEEFEGFSDAPVPVADLGDDEATEDEETEFSKYDDLLGSSSDEDDDEFNDERFQRFRGKETPNLDDISLSGGSGPDSDSEEEPDVDDASSSGSSSPPPAKKSKKKSSGSKSSASSARPTGSTFLPSLMGGYISGSESASDVDVEPTKKRLGQRQRQAIWEKKFGAKAKHLRQPAKSKGGRDSGWDMKRGAVEGGDGGRTPWKKGVGNPLSKQSGEGSAPRGEVQRAPTKKDDEGPLHPSWEARKKAKDSEKASFTGTKITFD
ncbi:Bud-site selection protein [Mariannaea sp. PMI_226]|nr:Bud-site selection protein [Mariannaea sp. PMI_226]